jgi:antitoxin (DNA-binding transcriptional repressor) of toxin-antitoxin stability system
MIVFGMTVRITEAELARDTHAVLEKVQAGVEIVVEQDHRPVVVIKTPHGPDRKISECVALSKAYEKKLGYAPVPDPDFAKDVQTTVDAHREPLNPPPEVFLRAAPPLPIARLRSNTMGVFRKS